MPTIQLENVTKWNWVGKRFRDRHREIAVSELNLTIEQGEFIFVIGSAGAGKSTLLKLIRGEIKPSAGRVLIDGADLTKLMMYHKRKTRQMFGVVTREGELSRRETVAENLKRAARAGRKLMESEKDILSRVQKSLGLVGMAQSGEKYPGELSRGECRRVELAYAMVNSPPILILDDLTANLDDGNIWDMLHLIKELNVRGTTVIMATHSEQYVNLIRERVVTLVDGQIAGDVKNGRYGVVK